MNTAHVLHVPAAEMYDEPHPNWGTVEVVRRSMYEALRKERDYYREALSEAQARIACLGGAGE